MKYKHALFLNPYIENNATSVMKLFPPIGLEYVAASAKNSVDKLTLLDLRYEKILCQTRHLLGFINEQKVDIICVNIGWDRQFGEICVLLNQLPDDIPLVIGGYKATEQVETLFTTCPKINIIVRGEGEDSIKEILQGISLENILGISYRKNGEVVHNRNRPLRPVDEIIPPERSLRRNQYILTLNNIPVTNLTFDAVLSARGCPYDCKFCTFSFNPLGQKRTYSARSVESVIKEIQSITADVVLFSDDNFGINTQRAERICDAIIENKIKKRFMAQVRIELAKSPALLKKMVSAGFKMLLIGIESPHDRILAQLNKGFDSETIRQSFAELKKYPIYYHGYFIYGNIGETEEEMLYISKFAQEIAVDSIAAHKLRIEKYSPLRELVDRTPGYHITPKGELYSDLYSHKALKKIGRKIKFSFYTPAKLLKILRKFFAVKLITLNDLACLTVVMPQLFMGVIIREIRKKRLIDSLKRIFTKNN